MTRDARQPRESDDTVSGPSLRVVAQQWVSADGFAAGPGGEQVIFESVPEEADAASQHWNETLLDSVDEVLLGRRRYESFVQFWPGADLPIAPRVNSVPKVVFSRTLTHASWGTHAPLRVEQDPVARVRRKRQAGSDLLLLWGSLELMHALMRAGEVDEFDLFIAPLLLGSGTPLLPDRDPLRLDQIEAETWPGAMHSRYGIRRPVEP